MWGQETISGRIILVAGIFLICLRVLSQGVTVPPPATAPASQEKPADLIFSGFHLPETKETLDYSFALSSYIYLNSPDASDNLILLQNLRYSWSVRGRKRFCLSSLLIHNLGLQIFPDSLSRFSPDDNQLTLKADMPIKLPVSVNVSLVMSSRLFSDFTILPSDSGKVVRRMNAGFLTPFVASLSAGLGLQLKSGSVSLGLSAARFTWVADKRVLSDQGPAHGQVPVFGVPAGKDCLLEPGLSLQVNACLNLRKWLRWTCDIYLFKKYDDVVNGNLKNMFSVQFSRYIRLNIQSRIVCDERLTGKLQLENVISLGFGLLR